MFLCKKRSSFPLVIMYSFFQGILLLCLSVPVACRGNSQVDCGSINTGSVGYIASPGFPADIPEQDVNCKWKINLKPSDVLTVSFTAFDFPSNSLCAYLRISPSLGDKDMVTYNGRNPPQDAYISSSSGAAMVITLVTCDAEPRPRFNLTYIQGPEYPSHPCPSNQFTCASGKCILNSWVCNGYNECGDDSDEQHNCATTTPYPHDGSCPHHHFACTSSSTGQMECFQELRKCDGHADCENGDDEESCSSVCTYDLEGNEGSISSPNYPKEYYNNLNCHWRITVDEGGVVQLRFVDFVLEAGFTTDFVKVYDGNKHDANGAVELIGLYYGHKQDIHSPPTVIESSGNSIIVEFYTDNSVTTKGFNASYQLKGHCIDHQKPCGEDDRNCFDLNRERCDGRYACHRGQDEMGCRNCSSEMIPCKQSNDDCFDPEDRCNGDMRCKPDGEDERSCPAEICGEHVGLFLCGDGTCIEESWMCDVQIDCTDGSDEENCPLSPKLVTAAVIGSLVCGMLLVAALSCTCKLYQLHHSRREGYSSSQVPYYVFGGEASQREAPPSYSATMASPHYAELQRAFVEGVQAMHGSSQSGRRITRRRSRFLNMLSQNSPSSPASNQSSENRSASEGAPPSGGAVEEPSRVSGITHGDSVTNSQPNEDSQNGIETSSFSTSDTDSETNQDAQLTHQILNAAANIHRMRIANRVFHLQNRARREDGNTPEESPQGQGETATPTQVEESECSSQGVTPEGEEDAREHDPAAIVGVGEVDDRDDVQLLDDI